MGMGRMTHLDDLASLAVVVHHRHGGLNECPCGSQNDGHDLEAQRGDRTRRRRPTESLDNALAVVVLPPRGLGALHETLEHDFLGGGEEEDEGGLADLVSGVSATCTSSMCRVDMLVRNALLESADGNGVMASQDGV